MFLSIESNIVITALIHILYDAVPEVESPKGYIYFSFGKVLLNCPPQSCINLHPPKMYPFIFANPKDYHLVHFCQPERWESILLSSMIIIGQIRTTFHAFIGNLCFFFLINSIHVLFSFFLFGFSSFSYQVPRAIWLLNDYPIVCCFNCLFIFSFSFEFLLYLWLLFFFLLFLFGLCEGKTHCSSFVSFFLSHCGHTSLLTAEMWAFHTPSYSLLHQLGVLPFNSILTLST